MLHGALFDETFAWYPKTENSTVNKYLYESAVGGKNVLIDSLVAS